MPWVLECGLICWMECHRLRIQRLRDVYRYHNSETASSLACEGLKSVTSTPEKSLQSQRPLTLYNTPTRPLLLPHLYVLFSFPIVRLPLARHASKYSTSMLVLCPDNSSSWGPISYACTPAFLLTHPLEPTCRSMLFRSSHSTLLPLLLHKHFPITTVHGSTPRRYNVFCGHDRDFLSTTHLGSMSKSLVGPNGVTLQPPIYVTYWEQ